MVDEAHSSQTGEAAAALKMLPEAARRIQGNRESPPGFLSCGICEKQSVIPLELATSDP
jgi:hypothetical protein